MVKQALLDRLDDIGRSLEESEHALALIGLGSVGLELARLDEYSDLDFFAIVETGYKHGYLEDLQWLSRLCPIAYCFRNTPDGYKLLFEDDIFSEFAVFELDELAEIPFAQGRIVWKQPYLTEIISLPRKALGQPAGHDREWLIGEALTNLYVGLAREKRGERLSAARFIQWYAVDRLMELIGLLEEAQPYERDAFAPDRRFEQRYPAYGCLVSGWMQGYQRNQESALAILNFLDENFSVNQALSAAIRGYCK